jgi:cell division protein FtsN
MHSEMCFEKTHTRVRRTVRKRRRVTGTASESQRGRDMQRHTKSATAEERERARDTVCVQSASQSVSQSANQPATNQSVSQSVSHQPISQPISQPPISQSANQPATNQSVSQSARHLVPAGVMLLKDAADRGRRLVLCKLRDVSYSV